jgi:magnesium chelatase family protein
MCNKAPNCAEDYQTKISGPLFDRFDIRVDVIQEDIFAADIIGRDAESSERIASRVMQARQMQEVRYQNVKYKLNAYVEGTELEKVTQMEPKAQDIIRQAMQKFSLSMRAYTRILRVARTIADLAGQDCVSVTHVAEAINLRITKLKA